MTDDSRSPKTLATKLSARRVLVIDDDKPFGEALSRWLTELGYEASVALSAIQGVALLKQGEFDAILLDLRLPDLSGHTIIRRLKNAGVLSPVIVVSGTTEMDDVVRAWRGNAADFLRKPFRIEDLSAALDKALRGVSGKVPSAPLAIPPASLVRVELPASTVVGTAATSSSRQTSGLRPALTKVVERLKAGTITLPILNPKVARLPEFLTTQNWSVDDLADTVTLDSNLAAGILRSANSAAHSHGKELTSLRDACARLGSKAVVAIAFEITVKGQFSAPQEPYRAILKNSWRNAIVASRVAPLLGEMLRIPDREDLRLATLFHNVGELLGVCLIGDNGGASEAVMTPEQLAAEVEVLHQDLGATLTTSWKLPALVIRLAGHHHRPSRQSEQKDEKLLRHLVLASWAISLRAGFTYFPGQEDVDPGAFIQAVGLTEQQVAPVYEKIKTWQVDP